jgi:hypothetical protein
MSEAKRRQKMFVVDDEKRQKRRRTQTRAALSYGNPALAGDVIPETGITTELAEQRQIVVELAKSFIGTIEFYKSKYGGEKSHAEATKEALQLNEWRRGYIENEPVEKVDWGQLSALAEIDIEDNQKLWARIREAAADELECGRRAAAVTGANVEPYALAQFLAIRDAFADQWQPTGAIESAMIDMMTIAFSLQMYWATIAHQRAIRTHDEQKKDLNRYESKGWKSPYQYEAEAVEQAHRLADSYNRQFLRVLRQLRDLRRYTVVINNNGGQVNLGAQQVNVQKND